MLPDKDIACHRTFGLSRPKSCRDMVVKHNCQLWQHIAGTNKNTGEHINRHMCLDSMQHMLAIETQSVVREMAGEVSQHRRENREQTTQAAQNMDALNSNLIRMHGQNTQLALMQVRAQAQAQLPDPDQPELPLSIEHDQRH